jgi:hypothetical protein
MSVAVDSASELMLASPRALIDWPYYMGELGRTYDVSRPDGARFLAVKNASDAADGGPVAPRVELILNWLEHVRALSPTA